MGYESICPTCGNGLIPHPEACAIRCSIVALAKTKAETVASEVRQSREAVKNALAIVQRREKRDTCLVRAREALQILITAESEGRTAEAARKVARLAVRDIEEALGIGEREHPRDL